MRLMDAFIGRIAHRSTARAHLPALALLTICAGLLSSCTSVSQQAAFDVSQLDPTPWQWYWKVLFVIGFPIFMFWMLRNVRGVDLETAVSAILTSVLGIIWFVMIVFQAFVSTLQWASQTVLALFTVSDMRFVAAAAVLATLGTILANAEGGGGSSRSTSHEWRYMNGGRYGDATNRDVWEHQHARGSWETQVAHVRVVYFVLAIAAPVVVLALQNPGVPLLLGTSASNLAAVLGATFLFGSVIRIGA